MTAANDWRRKLDHRLKATLDSARLKDEGSRIVSVFVRFNGDAAELTALGLAVRAVSGSIATASVRLEDVPRIAESGAISFLELGESA